MKVHQHPDRIPKIPNAVLTIGTFDGVHKGHQKIIRRILDIAAKTNGQSVILTFFPHPRMVLNPTDHNLKLLTTLEEKIELLRQYEVDHLVIVPFDRSFSSLAPETYVEDVLVKKIHPARIVIGYNHHFGNERSGNIELMKKLGTKFGFEVDEIPKQMVRDAGISSTKIRDAVLRGDIEMANEGLGRPFYLHGLVIKGNSIGHTLGFPTANLELNDPLKIIPANGVYAVKVHWEDQVYNGMLNIGFKPTVTGRRKVISIEVNIFEFDRSIYGELLRIDFYKAIRDEKKFSNLAELRRQLQQDKQASLTLLK